MTSEEKLGSLAKKVDLFLFAGYNKSKCRILSKTTKSKPSIDNQRDCHGDDGEEKTQSLGLLWA